MPARRKVREDVKAVTRVEDLAQRLFKAETRKQMDNEMATWLTCLIAFGQVKDSYRYDAKLPVTAHARDVDWKRDDVHVSALRERVAAIHEQSRTVYRPSAQQALITFTQGLPTG
ncbi:hypothetical protein [Streptomyces antarcticus]|uniref:hypothetical protein n=1 Tax=Streptomyces antarcticus TaxID=2996458 RepID=UPI00226F20AA|nr:MULTISPECIES: hypothetical protein [unclassified Streptomyces]MCY0947061.1 hypothetical protein [Streptomyces sp. H34-AA3]MCZ4084768.1 hypothetical protein [Streptomyces sp. H34-S5]